MKRRFIAGAVCPACGALDRTVVEVASDRLTRHCVACDDCETIRTDRTPGSPRDRSDAHEVLGAIPVVLK